MFQGFVQLESDLVIPVLVTTTGNVPVNADALPTYRVYGPSGDMANGSGALTFMDTGSITGASNASPIVVTSAGHGLSVGARVTITGALGNTATNGTWVVSAVTANTFTLTGSTGNGSYTSGGTWNVTGLYQLTVSALGSNGYEAGESYSVLVSGAISSAAWASLSSLGVI